MKDKSYLALLVVSVLLAVVGGFAVTGLLTTSKTIESPGTVKAINVEVYWDSACTQAVSQIDWGAIEPGDSVAKTVYIKSSGSATMTLNMSYSGWVPSDAGNHISLSWDKEGASVDPDAVVAAVLTLSVSNSISGITDFSFNIIIEGTG